MKRGKIFLVLTVFSFICFAKYALSADIYVSPAGGGSGSIGSPTDLQDALNTAQTNGAEDTIYLQEGTYDASTTGANTFTYESASNDGMKVTLSGSWNNIYTTQKTTDEPSTILDGGGTSRVLDIHADNVSFDFAIQYLDIRNGYLAASTGNGAGLRAFSENSGDILLTIHHVGFITNTTATGTGGGAGGGMTVNSYFEATDCYFKDNLANNAGAMYFTSTDQTMDPKIDNCVFEGNMTGSPSSVGNISTILFNNSPVITNSDFKGNPTWQWSASAVNSAGGNNSLTVDNCTFSDFNTAYWGGAIHLWNMDATITNSLFINNSAGNYGDGRGGALAFYDPNGPGNQITIANCTFLGNKGNPNIPGGSPGGAIQNRVLAITITNSIFWDNDNIDIYAESGTATISYSDIEGGLTGTNFTDGGNNINTDPLFANIAGDPSTWDFQLTASSPGVDQGDNTMLNQLPLSDLNGNVRFWDGDQDGQATVDMGPYEYGAGDTVFFRVTPTSDNDCHDHACDLQSALNASAAVTRLNKEIRLAKGTYTGVFNYYPVTNNNGNLSILGGWSSDFSLRTLDPINTILDANNIFSPLTLNNRPNKTTGSLKVEGLTLKNGLLGLNKGGGGIFATTFYPGSIEINNNIIENNKAGRSGGGILATSYDTISKTGGPITLSNNIIRNNTAGNDTDLGSAAGGGAFAYSAGSVLVTNNLVYSNEVGTDTVEGRGGGLFLSAYAGEVNIINNTIVTNRATTEAGGVFLTEAPSAWSTIDFQIYNNIIGSDPGCTECRENIFNDISNTLPAPGNSLTVAYNNYNELVSSTGSVTPTEMNTISGDPMFVSESTGKEDYHLLKGSPCIDAGDNTAPNMPSTDNEGETRPQDGDNDGTATANLGCYETLGGAFSWTMFLPAITYKTQP